VAGEILQHRTRHRRAIEHGTGLAQEDSAGLRQLDAAPDPVEQLDLITGFQRGNGGRRRRLAHAEGFGGTRHVSVFGNLDEDTKLIERHQSIIPIVMKQSIDK
jgi:hypothetical protein